MDRLLEVRIGGRQVVSGLLPVRAFEMFNGLLSTLREEGGDPEQWEAANPHVRINGADSTRSSIEVSQFARQLRPTVQAFKQKAGGYELGRRGYNFVVKNITSQAPWEFIEVMPIVDDVEAEPVRFDAAYREALEKRASSLLTGQDEVYAFVVRAGGEPPTGPTAQLRMADGTDKTFPVRDVPLVKALGDHLLEVVKLKVSAKWNPVTLERVEMSIEDILDWEDTHLYDVILEHGGVLPVDLTVKTVDELLAGRKDE